MARILLVDDDLAVRSALARVLSFGHEVTTAESVRAALAEITGAATSFDVVVCDVVMPGESGLVLQSAVAAIDPALARRFVFITGGTTSEQEVQALGLEVVLKPFSTAALEAAVVRTLARAAA